MNKTMRYEEEHQEWQAIKDELIAASPTKSVTAYAVSEEQRTRMKARGQRPLTPSEVIADVESQKPLGSQPMKSQKKLSTQAELVAIKLVVKPPSSYAPRPRRGKNNVVYLPHPRQLPLPFDG